MAITLRRFYMGRPTNQLTKIVDTSDLPRQLKQLIFTNSTSAVSYVTLHIVPMGGTPNEDNVFMSKIEISPKEMTSISFACFAIEPGDTIHALQSVDKAVTLHIHGVEV